MALYAAFFKKQYLVVENIFSRGEEPLLIEWQWKIREKHGSTVANASIASVHARVSCAVDSSTTDAIRMVASFFGRRSSTALLGFGREIVKLFFFGGLLSSLLYLATGSRRRGESCTRKQHA